MKKKLEEIKKQTKIYETIAMIFGIIGIILVIKSVFLIGAIFGFMAITFEIIHFILLNKFAKKEKINIDWKQYWFGRGDDNLKEKK